MSGHDDRPDFFDRMGLLLDNIEVRRGEFLRIESEQTWRLWGRLVTIHDDLEAVAIQIDREVRKARGEKVGPAVTLGTFARDVLGTEPVLGLAEVEAEIHEALDAKRVTQAGRDEVLATTPFGREYRLRRDKRPHEEASYVVLAVDEAK